MFFAVTIFPDKSIFSVIVVFIILYIALNRVLFQPLLRIVEERAKRTDGVMAESAKTLERYMALFSQYEQSIRTARSESYRLQEQRHAEAVQQGTERIRQARREAERMLEEAKQELQAQVEQAKTALATDATATAALISQMILQRPIGSSGQKGQPS